MGRPRYARRLRAALIRMACLTALATMAAGCAGTDRPAGARGGAYRGHVEAVLGRLRAEMAASLVSGPSRSLTQLEGMLGAHAMGEEGADAAALWDREIRRHYRSHSRALSAALEDEVRDRRSAIGHAIAQMPMPDPARSGDFADERSRRAISFFNSRAYRRAHIRAICASLASTPRAWAALHPRRAPLSLQRFGIDEPRIRRWCDAGNRD
jgi:hypothetical protein